MRIFGTAFSRRTAQAQRAERDVPRRDLAIRRTSPAPSNWYDAGVPYLNGTRSYIPEIVQDARLDQNFVARREMLRKARNFAKNSPVIKRALDVDEVYTLGSDGSHVTPMSADAEWNKRAKIAWQELCDSAGMDGEDLVTVFHNGFMPERTDGEVFMLKTHRRMTQDELMRRGNRAVGSRPAVQLVEAHRVETPMGRWGDEGRNVIDGVEISTEITPDGRKVARKSGYWVRSAFGMFNEEESWDFAPLSSIIHIGDAQRANQLRFVSAFYASIATTHDFEDLLLCEMRAAKDGAEKSTIIKTPSGELNDVGHLIRSRLKGTTGDTNEDDAWKKRAEFYQRTLGGRTLALKTGDEVTQYLNNRPTVASREYWLYLISVICASLGVSVLLVFPDFSGNDQGTAIRAELQIADQLFIRRGRKWRRAYASLWEYFMGWAINNDPRVANPPADWRKVLVYPPRSVNVDIGRNSAAMLEELNAGATDYELIYGPMGLDWEERFERLAKQQEKARELGLTLATPPQKPVVTVANQKEA